MRERFWDFRKWLVTTALVSGACVGAWLLHLDFMRTSGEGVGDPIGKILLTENQVRRKLSGGFSWNKAESGQALYRRDSIQTGIGGFASLELEDGVSLELQEQSLMVLDRLKELSFSLDQGIPEDLFQGKIILKTKAGDQILRKELGKKMVVEPLQVRLLSPQPFSKLTTTEEVLPLKFEWKLQGSSDLTDALVLEWSQDSKFLKPHYQTLSRDQTHFSKNLPEGLYFWRLSQKGLSISQVGRFEVQRLRSPEPLSPIGKSELSKSVRFQWRNPSKGIRNILEVEGPKNFQWELDPSVQSWETSDLAPGTYQWRIQSEFSSGEKLTSKWVSLSLSSLPPIAVANPEPVPSEIPPAPLQSLSLVDPSKSITVYDLSLQSKGFQIEWKPVEEATKYEVFLQSVSSKRAFRYQLEDPRFELSDEKLQRLSPGVYSIRARALGDRRPASELRELSRFELTLGAPLPPPKIKSKEAQ